MKKEDIIKRLDKFTNVCLFNETSIYSYKGTKEIIDEYVERAKNFDEFVDLVLYDERLEKNQGYWELARNIDNIDYNSFVKGYLKKIADEHLITYSDIGSILLGNKDFKIAINNGYGDCDNDIYIINHNVNIECLKFNTTFEGTDINIYEYDCAKSEDESLIKLSGRYAIYSFISKNNRNLGDRIFAIVKWN